MGVLDVLGGVAKTAGAGFNAFGDERRAKVTAALAAQNAAREAERDKVLNALTSAQTSRLLAPPPVEPPRREYDAGRGGIVDLDAGTFASVAPPKVDPPKRQVVDGQIVDVDAGTAAPIAGYVAPPKVQSDAQKAAAEGRIGQRENQLHDDFQNDPAVKQGGAIANAVAQLRASAQHRTPQGDLNMIYGIVKLRDPGSVVREGEIDLQKAARSLGTQVTSAWQKALSGKVLTDEERGQIMDLVNSTVDEQQKLVNPVMARYGAAARGAKADSAFVAPNPLEAVSGPRRPPGFIK